MTVERKQLLTEEHDYLCALQTAVDEGNESLLALTEEEEQKITNAYRASGIMICEKCGKDYYAHPHYKPSAKTTNGEYYWLHEICNGNLVKL